jgi:hypothetical protein
LAPPLADHLIEADKTPLQIKSHLNRSAFAGPDFPTLSCAVPSFDFSDVRTSDREDNDESNRDKAVRLKKEFQQKGYIFIGQHEDKLVFRGTEKSLVEVDLDSGIVRLDVTQ